MNRLERRSMKRKVSSYIKRENARYDESLTQIAREQWPSCMPSGLIEVWRSRDYLVQVFEAQRGIIRLTVCRTGVNFDQGSWMDGITWDTLQQLKRQCGRGHLDAVEVFPSDQDVVNVANMRHLWVLPEKLDFAWRSKT